MLLLKQSFSLLLSFSVYKSSLKRIFLQRFSSVRVGTLEDHIVRKHSDLNLDIVAEKRELVQAHFRSSLLDLPAAFDTINQSILKPRLKTSFVLSGSCSLLVPYLSLRPRPVYVNHSKSLTTILQFGVSQGSVLGPNMFVLNTQMKWQISDDTQNYATAHLSKAF